MELNHIAPLSTVLRPGRAQGTNHNTTMPRYVFLRSGQGQGLMRIEWTKKKLFQVKMLSQGLVSVAFRVAYRAFSTVNLKKRCAEFLSITIRPLADCIVNQARQEEQKSMINLHVLLRRAVETISFLQILAENRYLGVQQLLPQPLQVFQCRFR